jgi:hypothetical protein
MMFLPETGKFQANTRGEGGNTVPFCGIIPLCSDLTILKFKRWCALAHF